MEKIPNIFLITIDCLRVDYLGCFIKRNDLTPNLDKVAKDGVMFTQAIANGPSTPFSFPSIFLSSFALVDPKFPKIPNYNLTIAKALKSYGYQTAGFNSNPYLSKYYNYNLGFTFFDDIFSEEKQSSNKGIKKYIKKYEKLYHILQKIYKKIKLKHKIHPPYERASKINKKVLKWIRNSEREFFVWIHYMDTHHPFIPPKEFRNTSVRKIYRAEKMIRKNPLIMKEKDLENIKNQYINTIKYVDYELGRLFTMLKSLGFYDNSLIIITADHGEEFKEHGGLSHECKLYEELIHVPLIISGPKIPKNLVINNLICHLDIAPTIIDYLNFEDGRDFLGLNLMDLIINKNFVSERVGIISESLVENNKVSLSLENSFIITSYRTNEWKLIINEETNQKELYNLLNDPDEKRNLYNPILDIANDLEKAIIEHKNFVASKRAELREKQKITSRVKKVIFENRL